jgi:hypothetical protein
VDRGRRNRIVDEGEQIDQSDPLGFLPVDQNCVGDLLLEREQRLVGGDRHEAPSGRNRELRRMWIRQCGLEIYRG